MTVLKLCTTAATASVIPMVTLTDLVYIPGKFGRAYKQHSEETAEPWSDCILFQPQNLVADSATAG